MRKANKSRCQSKKRHRSYFSTHIFQPPVGLLVPVRERTENRGVCVRENAGSLCWAVKELESESTIQTSASPSLILTQHKG